MIIPYFGDTNQENKIHIKSYNVYRSQNAKNFKKKKRLRKLANISRKKNRK